MRSSFCTYRFHQCFHVTLANRAFLPASGSGNTSAVSFISLSQAVFGARNRFETRVSERMADDKAENTPNGQFACAIKRGLRPALATGHRRALRRDLRANARCCLTQRRNVTCAGGISQADDEHDERRNHGQHRVGAHRARLTVTTAFRPGVLRCRG